MTKLRSIITATMLVLTVFAAGSLAQNREMVTNDRLDMGKRVDNATVETRKTKGLLTDSIIPEVASTNNYVFSTTLTGSLTDMSTGTTQLLAGNIDDTASALTNIGFDFFFQGVRYTTFSINDNGNLRLGATSQTSTPYHPLAQAGIPIITAYGGDQRTHTGDGKVHYKVIGSAPNRTLVIEWLNNQSNFNTGGTADLTYQVRLNESTGIIEFVYGSMTMSTLGAADTNSRDPNIGFSSNNTATNVGSVTAPQSGAPAPTYNGASATPVANLYTAGAITTLTSAANGSRRTFAFASPAPNAPSNNLVSGITQTSLTLNWLDNSSNETQFAVYRSTDNLNFTFLGSAAENATSFPDSGLTPGTMYFYNVYAVSEGALSTVTSFGATTSPAGNDSCNGAGGNWNTPATWADNTVPGAGDNVTIGAGCTVTIDTAAVALAVTVSSGGILQFEDVNVRTLSASSVTVNSGGTFRSAATGTVTTHNVSIAGSLINNGTIDFSTNADTAGATITFTGANNANFTLAGGSTTDLRQTGGVTINKGTSIANELTFSPGGTLTVQGANTAGFLTITNGLFTVGGSGAFSNPLFSVAAYTIPATGGLRMNNTNATVVGQTGSSTLAGRFQMTLGTFNIGTAADNAMGFSAGANILVEGGAINSTGRFGVAASGNAITYSQTGGTITVCTVGNTSITLGSFDLGTGTGTTSITGGTIVIQLASTAASGPRDFRNQSGLTGTTTVTAGTVQFGNAASGAAKAFSAAGVFPNVLVDNTSAGHSVTLLAPAVFNNVTRSITISTGATFNIGNNVFLMNGTTLTNNGTLTANGASSNFVWFLTTSPQTYTGTGVATAPITNFAVQADMGLTMNAGVSNVVVGAIRLFSGSVINSNKITLGNGGATTGVVQIGNTTTPTACGTFDQPFTFNLGTGGQTVSYLRCTASRSTGPEINPARSVTTFTYDDNNAAQNLTLAGGNLTVTGTMALTNGVLLTGNANTIVNNGTATRTTGFVDGNLGRDYSAPGTYTYFVGQGAFTPVLANVTAVTATSRLTARSFNATLAGFNPPTSLSRNWSLEETGDLTADLSFTYDTDANDVNGNESDYRVYRREGNNTVTNMCSGGPCVNTATNTLGPILGVTTFSRWTGAENQTPVAANASIAGRVTTSGGNGIRNAVVEISGGDLPAPIMVQTGSFGYYQFDGLVVGRTYVVTVVSKRFTFANSTRVIGLQSDITDFDFVAEP